MKIKVFTIKYILPVITVLVCFGLLYWRFVYRSAETGPVRGIELTKRYRSELIGRPAPELQKIKGWKNGGPMTLAELRGKYVLLDFWGYWCGPCLRDIPHLMAIYDAFSDRGLMVIGIHDDSLESIDELDEKLATAREKIWMGRDLNFPIALDGGGRTRIAGTDETVPGATTAAYGVRMFPTTLLIDADGKVIGRFHAPSLDDKISELEELLGVEAKKPEWRVPFDKVYRLDEGEVLRYIAEPYIPERSDFFFYQFSRWGWFSVPMRNMPSIPESAELIWDEKKNQVKGGMRAGRKDLRALLWELGFYEREYEGDPILLEQRIAGDWVKRERAAREELLVAFEKILNEKLNLRIRFVPDEVERDVFVRSGTFDFHPLGGEYGNNQIHLFVEKPDPADNIQGGGGSGDLDSFLNYVGGLGKQRIINADKTVVEDLTWRQHSSTRGGRLKGEPALFEMLLKNVGKQTSLRFKKERRKEKIWLVKSLE
ncbi:MAG: peroxiredoxin family protein [Planctomycetota bacterium]|jgi:thiol-disulfide isomerase/thioredoxin